MEEYDLIWHLKADHGINIGYPLEDHCFIWF